jgi:hypothetical protein
MNKLQTDLAVPAGSVAVGYEGCFALAVPFKDTADGLEKGNMWLRDSDITPTEACVRIQSLNDMRCYFLFAQQQVERGGRRNLRNAERITRLCLIHPFLGEAAQSVRASS